jgi:tetratricopeptide (TPR) repeat protein
LKISGSKTKDSKIQVNKLFASASEVFARRVLSGQKNVCFCLRPSAAKRIIFPSSIYFILFLLLPPCLTFLSGCSSDGTKEAVKISEYKKTMDAQKQKSDLAAEEDALKKVPDPTADSYERMGDAYLKQGNLDKAFITYNKGLDLNPKSIRVRYKMAGLFLTKGLVLDAEQGFLSIIQDQPDFAPAYEGLGKAYYTAGNLGKALSTFNQALQINPQSWQAQNYLGIIKDRQKQYDQAIIHFRAAIALKPEAGLLYNNLGMCYVLKGDYEKAVLAFNEALRKGEVDDKVNNNLAQAYIELKKYDEALDVLKETVGAPEAYLKIGNLYLKDKKYEEAIDCFEKAIELSPKYNQPAVEKLRLAKKYLKETASPKSGIKEGKR